MKKKKVICGTKRTAPFGMCGIWARRSKKPLTQQAYEDALDLANKQEHRGPDYVGTWPVQSADDEPSNFFLIHHRLAIVDPESGAQPLRDPKTGWVLAVNGEIYNHEVLRKKFPWYTFRTRSDCEIFIPLLETARRACDDSRDVEANDAIFSNTLAKLLRSVEGMFAFVAVRPGTKGPVDDCMVIARDHPGIIPLYYMESPGQNDVWVASEMKALPTNVDGADMDQFSPGGFRVTFGNRYESWYQYAFMPHIPDPPPTTTPTQIRRALEKQVQSHLMTDVPYGVLLSGGLDSSLIAAMVMKHARKRVETGGVERAWWPTVHSFSVGLKDSPDLEAAAKVARALGTVHHVKEFTVEEALAALPRVIRHIETYDPTTIRSSTPMVLMADMIRTFGVKMVLSGEGADELFGGYLYFAKAPNAVEFDAETRRLISGLHQKDCLRANKAMMAAGVEARVPFLGQAFLQLVMQMDPQQKMITPDQPVEKWILRQAAAHPDLRIPESVVTRQKEQFSDGVGYDWIDGVQAFAKQQYPAFDAAEARNKYPINPPRTPEEMLYRDIFVACFGDSEPVAKTVPWGPSIACSTPTAVEWDADFATRADPSGRSLRHHVQSNGK